MQTPILQESNYKEEMQTIVEPYLVSIGTEFYLERHAGQKIHCMHYVPENPHAVVMLSHGLKTRKNIRRSPIILQKKVLAYIFRSTADMASAIV